MNFNLLNRTFYTVVSYFTVRAHFTISFHLSSLSLLPISLLYFKFLSSHLIICPFTYQLSHSSLLFSLGLFSTFFMFYFLLRVEDGLGSCHAMPCHAMPCHAMPCHAMPCHAMPCHAMPSHAMPCRVTVVSCRVESHSTKFYTGRLRSEVQTLTLLYTIFERKGNPFVYLS